jgi:hypothetical protein
MAESNIDRIHEREDGLQEAERRLEEVRMERDEARELVHRMEEQVGDASAVIESWKEAFEMQLTRVLQLRKAGTTLRVIAEETNLDFQMVRTIIGRARREAIEHRPTACRKPT